MPTNRNKFIETVKSMKYSTYLVVKSKGRFDLWDGGILAYEDVEFDKLPKNIQKRYNKHKM